MDHPIDARLPAAFQRLLEFSVEMFVRLLVRHLRNEGVLQIFDVAEAGDFRNSRVHHHHEQGDEESTVVTQDLESSTAQSLKPKKET